MEIKKENRASSIKTDFLFQLYSVFLFISILKFGSPASLPEINIFPANIFEWLIFPWPSPLFTLFSGLLLLITVFICQRKKNIYHHSSSGNFVILLTLASFFSLLGFCKTTCYDFAYLQCFYIFGLSAFSIAIYNLARIDSDKLRTYTINAVFWSSIIIIVYGMYQFFYGFASTREIFLATCGHNISLPKENFYTRLMQNYIFSTFSLPNTLGGFLILTVPVCLWFINHKTQSLLKPIISTIIAFLFISSIYMTGSRTAIASFFISITIIVLIIPLNKKLKFSVFLIEILAAAACFFSLSIKGLGSFIVRLDYFQVALEMLKKNLLTGAGWGSFFFNYGFMKSFSSPEAAHTPHNFFLLLSSQAGIFTGIFTLIAFLLPIILIINRQLKKKSDNIQLYILCGLIALIIHMSFDVDFQVPAIMIVLISFSIIVLSADSISVSLSKTFVFISTIVQLLIVVLILFYSYKLLPAAYSLQKLYSSCFPCPANQKINLLSNSVAKKNINNNFKEAVSLQPYSPYPWATIGNYYLKNKNWKNAETSFEHAIELSPRQASFYHKTAISQIYQRKYIKAEKNLKKAAELFPNLYEKSYNKYKKRFRSSK